LRPPSIAVVEEGCLAARHETPQPGAGSGPVPAPARQASRRRP